MQALGYLTQVTSSQVYGLILLIVGIVLVVRKNDHDNQNSIQNDYGIALIVIGALLILSAVNFYDLLPKGAQQNHGDSSDFDMLGGSSKSK